MIIIIGIMDGGKSGMDASLLRLYQLILTFINSCIFPLIIMSRMIIFSGMMIVYSFIHLLMPSHHRSPPLSFSRMISVQFVTLRPSPIAFNILLLIMIRTILRLVYWQKRGRERKANIMNCLHSPRPSHDFQKKNWIRDERSRERKRERERERENKRKRDQFIPAFGFLNETNYKL